MTTAVLHSLPREQRVLSHLNLDGSRAMQLCAENGLTADCFYDPKARGVFEAAEALHARNQLFDGGEILAEEAMKRDASFTPSDYVQLTMQIPAWGIMSAELAGLCKALKQLKRERAIKRAAETVATALTENDPDRVKEALQSLQGADTIDLPRATWRQTGDVALEQARAIIAGKEDPDFRSVFWPWSDFDRELKPFRRGELVVVAGFASLGKSSMLRQLCLHAATKEANVAFVSLEVPAVDIFNLMASAHSGQPWSRLKGLHPRDQNDFLVSGAKVRSLSISVLDDAHALSDIIAWVRQQHKKRFIDVLAIDYLGLIDECQARSGQTKAQAVGEVAGAFKRLSGDLGCVTLMAVQVNRGPMNDGNRAPRLTDLKDSGDIEAHADRVLLLYRPDNDKANKIPQAPHDSIADRPRFYMEIFQEKGRNVGTGSASLWFRRELARFELLKF